MLVHVLAAAGKSAEALALGNAVAKAMDAVIVGPSRHADLLVALVRAAVAAGDPDAAVAAAEEARRVAGPRADPALVARIDAITAEVALDRVDLKEAERLCGDAITGAGHSSAGGAL